MTRDARWMIALAARLIVIGIVLFAGSISALTIRSAR